MQVSSIPPNKGMDTSYLCTPWTSDSPSLIEKENGGVIRGMYAAIPPLACHSLR